MSNYVEGVVRLNSEPCYCGATDCPKCHPELQRLEECPCCGRKAPLWYTQEHWGKTCCDQCDQSESE